MIEEERGLNENERNLIENEIDLIENERDFIGNERYFINEKVQKKSYLSLGKSMGEKLKLKSKGSYKR